MFVYLAVQLASAGRLQVQVMAQQCEDHSSPDGAILSPEQKNSMLKGACTALSSAIVSRLSGNPKCYVC